MRESVIHLSCLDATIKYDGRMLQCSTALEVLLVLCDLD